VCGDDAGRVAIWCSCAASGVVTMGVVCDGGAGSLGLRSGALVRRRR